MVAFLREMIAIPSESADEKRVIERVVEEMRRSGFDEVRDRRSGQRLGPRRQWSDRHRPGWTRRHGRGRRPVDLDSRSVPRRTEGRHRVRARRRRPGSWRRRRGLRRAHLQGTGPHRRRAAVGHRHGDGGRLRRAVLAVHPPGEGAAARRRRDHRADQPRRVPRAPRAHGDRGEDPGALVSRLGARARHQRRLSHGAHRRGHRAPERAAGSAPPTRSSARAPSRSPTSGRRRRRSAPWPTAARSTSTGG